MLKWLGSLKTANDGHPLAPPKELQRVVGELRTADAAKAVEEVTAWLEGVAGSDGLKIGERFDIIKALDEAAAPHRAKTARDYAATGRQSKFREQKSWALNFDLWRCLAAVYLDLMRRIDSAEKGFEALKPHATLLSVRALRAQTQMLKWLYVHYGPVDNDLWQGFGAAYRFAEMRKAQRQSVVAYPATSAGETTPEQELLRGLLLCASSPDGLTQTELEVCERLIAHFAKAFSLSAKQEKESTYWFDLSMGKAPMRLAAPPGELTNDLRLFSCAQGHAAVQALIGRIAQTQEVPREVDLAGMADVQAVLDVLQHLELMWAPLPPIRKSQRKRMQTRVAVVNKFETMLQLCSTDTAATPQVDVDLDFGQTGVFGTVESWLVENVSAGGFGAVIQQKDSDWLRVGRLILVQATGMKAWELALVRRLAREANGQSAVGVQVIARMPITASFTSQAGFWNNGQPEMTGLFMPDASEAGAVLLALPYGMYNAGEQVRTTVAGINHTLFPIGTIERGDDFELLKFRDMVQQ